MGQRLLPQLGQTLSREFGNGFDASTLRYMRLRYQAFPNCDALRHELSWTHYRLVLPSEEDLRQELERDRMALEMQARAEDSDEQPNKTRRSWATRWLALPTRVAQCTTKTIASLPLVNRRCALLIRPSS
jgi:DUF1016 N-terminal domain